MWRRIIPEDCLIGVGYGGFIIQIIVVIFFVILMVIFAVIIIFKGVAGSSVDSRFVGGGYIMFVDGAVANLDINVFHPTITVPSDKYLNHYVVLDDTVIDTSIDLCVNIVDFVDFFIVDLVDFYVNIIVVNILRGVVVIFMFSTIVRGVVIEGLVPTRS